MKSLGVLLGFAPWIVFMLVSGPSTWLWAALAALVVALVLAVPDWLRTREIGVLQAAGIAFFGVLSVLALVLNPADLQWVEDRAQLLSSLVLTVVAGGSLAVGRPFTEYYARQAVPREHWSSPLFKRVNVVITAVWTVTFLLIALCDLVVVAAPGSGALFNWVLPVLLIVAAVVFTKRYPERVRRTAAAASAHDPDEPGPVTA
jgi:intracellular septation protein A